jgi:hypothetical protein
LSEACQNAQEDVHNYVNGMREMKARVDHPMDVFYRDCAG